MKDFDLGWIAALIDGEGSICLNKSHYKPEYRSRPAKRGFSWHPRVHVYNNSRELLEHFQKITGFGHIIKQDYDYPTRENHRPGYDLLLRHDEIRSLLPQITNHLIVRKRNAELLIETLELMEMYQSLGPVEDITRVRDKRLEAVYWELRLLNARGKGGDKEVLEQIARLPFDPRKYTRKKFESEMETTLGAQKKRKYETHLKCSREWKARNRERMREYWRKWHTKQKVKSHPRIGKRGS